MTSDIRSRAATLIANTPGQLFELQQHVSPTHRRGESGGGAHVKPTSRPPLQIDPLDAVIAEEKQVLYWSEVYGCQYGTVGRRVQHLLASDIPEWDCENILEAWGPIRSRNEKRWPTGVDAPKWISEAEAVALVGRDKRTLRRWRANNPHIGRVGPLGVEYNEDAMRKVWHAQIKRAENSLTVARSLRRSA